jgi:hypothetical protein
MGDVQPVVNEIGEWRVEAGSEVLATLTCHGRTRLLHYVPRFFKGLYSAHDELRAKATRNGVIISKER